MPKSASLARGCRVGAVVRGHEDVAGLHIAVHDPAIVAVGERVGDGGADDGDLLAGERAVIHRLTQVVALNELEDEHRAAVLGRRGVEQRHEPGVVEGGEHRDLGLVPAHVVAVGELGLEDLESDASGELLVGGLVDGGHAAATDEPLDEVPLGDDAADALVRRLRLLLGLARLRGLIGLFYPRHGD